MLKSNTVKIQQQIRTINSDNTANTRLYIKQLLGKTRTTNFNHKLSEISKSKQIGVGVVGLFEEKGEKGEGGDCYIVRKERMGDGEGAGLDALI